MTISPDEALLSITVEFPWRCRFGRCSLLGNLWLDVGSVASPSAVTVVDPATAGVGSALLSLETTVMGSLSILKFDMEALDYIMAQGGKSISPGMKCYLSPRRRATRADLEN